jgi:hypothetical protein
VLGVIFAHIGAGQGATFVVRGMYFTTFVSLDIVFVVMMAIKLASLVIRYQKCTRVNECK